MSRCSIERVGSYYAHPRDAQVENSRIAKFWREKSEMKEASLDQAHSILPHGVLNTKVYIAMRGSRNRAEKEEQ